MSIKKAIELVGIYYGKALTLEYVHKKSGVGFIPSVEDC